MQLIAKICEVFFKFIIFESIEVIFLKQTELSRRGKKLLPAWPVSQQKQLLIFRRKTLLQYVFILKTAIEQYLLPIIYCVFYCIRSYKRP